MPSYDPLSVNRGELMTRKKDLVGLREFYHGNGKDEPGQMDNRILKDNEYFWREMAQERKRFKDFSVEKRKEDERKKRLAGIQERKKLPDERNEMCDAKYFQRIS